MLQAMDILDQEASEDEGQRKNASKDGRSWDRLPSYEANIGLTNKEKRYRQMLDHAGEADETVRLKWEQWEDAITRLTWDDVCFLHFSLVSTFLTYFRKILNNGFHRQPQPQQQKLKKILQRRKLSYTHEHYVSILKNWTSYALLGHSSRRGRVVSPMQTTSSLGLCEKPVP